MNGRLVSGLRIFTIATRRTTISRPAARRFKEELWQLPGRTVETGNG